MTRWQVEQVLAVAPKPSAINAAQPLAVPTRWQSTGCDADAVWGRCRGSGSEPYDTVVDHVRVGFRCSCPSRQFPCKHALALLLLWARGDVPAADPSAATREWIAKRAAEATRALTAAQPSAPVDAAAVDDRPVEASAVAVSPSSANDGASAGGGEAAAGGVVPPPESSTRDDRVARMAAGLRELQRWLEDRVRTGLADPALARYATWDHLAARLVDAQVGGLANRVRRLAGLVGNGPDWHGRLLAEMGVLYALATAGLQHPALLDTDADGRPTGLADSVAAAIGWQVRQADVLAGVGHTDQWMVMGRSDTREDRIEVRRTWLLGRDRGQWAMSLSFAAYGQSLDVSLPVGSQVHADVYRYRGALGARAVVAARHSAPVVAPWVRGVSIADACAAVGAAIAAEPWIDRWPVHVHAHVAADGRGGWVLTDHSGSLPIQAASGRGLDVLIAATRGAGQTLTAEWTPDGLVPLTVHLIDHAGAAHHLDIGPTADPSFVNGVAA